MNFGIFSILKIALLSFYHRLLLYFIIEAIIVVLFISEAVKFIQKVRRIIELRIGGFNLRVKVPMTTFNLMFSYAKIRLT